MVSAGGILSFDLRNGWKLKKGIWNKEKDIMPLSEASYREFLSIKIRKVIILIVITFVSKPSES